MESWRSSSQSCEIQWKLSILQSETVRPVTEWQQAPYFAWGIFRPVPNFWPKRFQNFCPGKCVLAAILDFSMRYQCCVTFGAVEKQGMVSASQNLSMMYLRVCEFNISKQNKHLFFSFNQEYTYKIRKCRFLANFST